MTTVRKVMQTIVPTIKKEARVYEAAKMLSQGGGCLIVMDDDRAAGIVTTLDIIRNDLNKSAELNDPVLKLSSSPMTLMTPDMNIEQALKISDTKRYRQYPVIENGKLVGIVTKKEIITAVSDNLKFHLNIQTTVLAMFVVFELFVFFYFYLPRIL